MDNNAIISGKFNTPLSTMDRSFRQKTNMDIMVFNYTSDQIDLTYKEHPVQ